MAEVLLSIWQPGPIVYSMMSSGPGMTNLKSLRNGRTKVLLAPLQVDVPSKLSMLSSSTLMSDCLAAIPHCQLLFHQLCIHPSPPHCPYPPPPPLLTLPRLIFISSSSPPLFTKDIPARNATARLLRDNGSGERRRAIST